ncbi:MAG: aminotransferase class III-fold pyridoxal phosphate-dependent enzyme [Candidatus Micrarchaeota archaeon]|nr:aminotransferase class III-fold pyridoxal phosphate-dependent enzyme [Candidatus Micrarchaeota archaeon]MDE1823713.1 aminotransferase class III-fold pyridoxal phosphate-dependent enzyme [Candidatus Micrarchaeota archaeon]MDE1849187.1 aminotransferase class III-fold pyridoxal phosphate-dependent enzyme [Candidatus Micrarchaeota archaeon]
MGFKIGKKIRAVIRRDKEVMLTTTKGEHPLVSVSGDGDYITDIEGNRFLDFATFISVYNFGVNSSKEVRNAVKAQIDKLMHAAFTDFYAELPVTFSENLVKMFPKGFGRVFFSNSGSEANEAAIKFSRIFTKKQYILAFYNSFHGRTLGSLSLTSSKLAQREHFGPFNSAIHVPYAYCYRCPFGKEYPSCGIECVDYIRKYPLSKEVSPKEVAAIFMEPIQGEGGYIVPPKEFVKGIREIASDNGFLMVADEVQSGYFRAGKFLALDNFGVEADMYTMAKAAGAGLPIGITVTRKSLGDTPPGAHSNTFGGNLVSVAAANELLNYIQKNKSKLESDAKTKGAYIMKRLNKMKDSYEIIGDVRGMGMMIGVEFVRDRKSKEPAAKERNKIMEECFNNFLVLLPSGVSTIRIIPPITMSMANIEKGMDVIDGSISKINRQLKVG